MASDLAARLRMLRQKNGWTTVEMSYRCGLPKRTLEKYMLRDGASLPGFDALVSMSKGFGVSLDWLVFGSEAAGETVQLLVNRCASEAGQTVFETLLRYFKSGELPAFSGEQILNLSVEEWASVVGNEAAKKARELSDQGVTKEELLMWERSVGDRLVEILHDKAEAFMSARKTSNSSS